MRLSPSAVALALTLALGAVAASAEDDALRAAHEAVRAALLERATLPARPPSLPDGATMMEPRVRADEARRARSGAQAHERAVRRGEQHRARHMDRDGTADGPRSAGCRTGTPRATATRRRGRCGRARCTAAWTAGTRTVARTVARTWAGDERRRRLACGGARSALTLGAPDGGAEAHLLAGAAHFRAARYAEALVEFRVAERLESARPPPTRARRS
jgi:hypothetical protein